MSAIFAAIRVFTYVYDFITWPIYYFLYAPDEVARNSAKVRAKRLSNDPEASWRCVESFDKLVAKPTLAVDSMADMFRSAVAKYPSRRCLGTRELLSEEDELQSNGRMFKKLCFGDYHWETFEEVNIRVDNLGHGLLTLGMKPHKRLLIFAETRAEWQIAVNAAFRFNFPVVTLYSTLGDEAIVYGINQAEVDVVITSDQLVGKLQNLLPQIPQVKQIVYMNNGIFGGSATVDLKAPQASDSVQFHAMTSVERLGKQAQQADGRRPQQLPAGSAPSSGDLAVIMYTSGSTGLPKGVMITHGNLMATVASAVDRIPYFGRRPDDVYIGYLPLAHVLELMAELACLTGGVPIGYSSPLTLSDVSNKIKRGTKGDISVLRPTLMAAVPAIMDRISKNVWEKVNDGGAAKRTLFNWAYEYKKERMLRGMPSPLLDKVIFNKVKLLLGGRVRVMLSGGAPLSTETQRFMNVCFGIPIVQGYGLTETTGAGTVQTVDDISTGRAGPPLACCQIRLRDWPDGGYSCRDQPCPRGEVLIGGNNVTQGYFKMPDKTKEDFFVDADGVRWFCTGDIGLFNVNGTLEIVDRKKDLVKLQGGEYISLGKVETALGVSSYVEQLCIYGDSFKDHTVAIVVPKKTQVVQLAEKLGRSSGDYESLLGDKAVKETILKDLQSKAGGKVERFELPTRIHLTPEPWTPESGLVTDALKLKRRQLQDHFQSEIDRMYASG